MPEIEIFQFQGADIRVIDYEGQRVAYMPDVAQVFGLRPNNVVPTLDPWDYVTLAAEKSAAALNRQDVQRVSPYWLTESGIMHLSYRLSPELRQLVNEEVLPSIRRTGAYVPKLTNKELALMVLAEITEKEVALAQLAIAGPKAAYYDAWLNTDGLIGKMDFARMLRERFGGKVGEWQKRLTEGGDFPLWGKGSGARIGSIILAHHVTMGRGANKYVEDAHGGDRLWLQGFATKEGVEWVLRQIQEE